MFGIAVPTSRSVARAVENVRARITSDGLADLRPTPSEVVDANPDRTVRRFRSTRREATGAPVLLVTPLAAPRWPSTCAAGAASSSTCRRPAATSTWWTTGR